MPNYTSRATGCSSKGANTPHDKMVLGSADFEILYRERSCEMNDRLSMGLFEAAKMLGLSHWTLRQWIRQGRLKAVRLGKRVMVEPNELQRLVEEGRCGGQS